MLDDSLPNPSAAELERLRRDALCPSERADAISYDWARIWFGIAMAGGAYPLVLAIIVTAFGAVMFAWAVVFETGAQLSVSQGFGVVVMIALYAVSGAMIGILWSGLVTVLTLPVVYLIAWSLNLHSSIVRIGAFAGGLVGFICVLPLTLSIPWMRTGSADILEMATVISLGPMLAIVLGQLGGAWGGHTSRELGPACTWRELAEPALWTGQASSSPDEREPTRPRIRFRIRDLLWISVWLSLLLALIRVCRIPYELFLPLMLGWLLFQTATMWVGGLLARWWVRRRELRRQSRST